MKERWDQVTALFGAARELMGPDRESFLAIACQSDPGLRSEVEALLARDVPDDDFLENPPWMRADSLGSISLTPGQVLKDRYRVEGELAAGGQALVYKACDQLLRRSVVIKVMRAEARWNHLLRARFEQEMRALARIDHPGVVGILDVGELEDGSPFLVIQHIPGMSLREALREGPLAAPRISRILRQMGAALRAAHAADVAHRDLKPENIMLQPLDNGGEFVKLIDFGIAKIDKSASDTRATTVMLAGTVRYMAPEQFDGQNSTASDLYSMALVACEMLSGHPDLRALPKKTNRATRARWRPL